MIWPFNIQVGVLEKVEIPGDHLGIATGSPLS